MNTKIGVSEELEKREAAKLENAKFRNWKLITSAVSERVKKTKGLQFEEIPSRSLLLRQSEFPASTVRGAISLDGQMLDLYWQVRERVGGLVEEASDTFGVRLSENNTLSFTRNGETFTLEQLSELILSLATKF